MRTYTRLLAMMLCCVLLLGLSMTAAHADTCYETLKYTFSMEENGDFAYLGMGTLVDSSEDADEEAAQTEEAAENEKKYVLFLVDFENGYASVTGLNADGAEESCIWLEAQEQEMMSASLQVAASYEQLSGYLDECDELVMVLVTSAEGEPIYVSSVADAEAYLTMIQLVLEDESVTGTATETATEE